MYNVFFVEDEPMNRESIRRYLGQHSEKYNICGEAGDGEMALSIIHEVQPDILITDIKMPFMDGLELSRLVKEIIPRIKIIILSAHGEFSLAQNAIEIGVNKYLLKPILKDELIVALDQIAEEIDKESLTTDVDEDMLVKFMHFCGFMESVYAGRMSTSDAIATAKKYGVELLAKYYIVLNVHIDSQEILPSNSIISSITKLGKQHLNTCWSFNNISHVTVLLKSSEKNVITEYAYLLAQSIKYNIKKDISSDCTISISSIYERISAINNAFNETVSLHNTFGETNKGHIFSAADIDDMRNVQQDILPSFDSVNLSKHLRYASMDDIDGIVKDIEDKLDSNGMGSVLYRYYITMDLIRYANQVMPNGKYELRYDNLNDIFKTSCSSKGFSGILRSVITDIISSSENKIIKDMHFSVIQKACDYIDKEFCSPDLSLKTVAAYVAFSPTHFSTMFSQQMGKTFIEYLTEIRIEKAKELLANSDEKLANIAIKIGYNEPNYFSYLFKKRVGIPPKEYRRQNHGKSLYNENELEKTRRT